MLDIPPEGGLYCASTVHFHSFTLSLSLLWHASGITVISSTHTGGGRGPVFSGKGGIRPSYQVMDSTAVQLPSYQPKVPHTVTHNTQKRMGFTW